ncbi:MAG: Uxx-star family glutaredoxin-like (seleno)protein [Dehalococcoidales bacterium]|nr:Uxx-star family glutaredoxin-like (seleno)protein [Dehalococcoidales bacterium]
MVKIYTTPTCGYCQMAKRFLAERGVAYEEYDVSHDPTAADEMVRLTGQMGVPVIMVDDEVVIGFDRQRLEGLLARGSGGGSQRPRFGLKVADAVRVAERFGVTPVSGAVVGAVASGSAGEQSGLRIGDVIIEVNTRRITNAEELERALAGLTTGSWVSLVFLRDNQKRKSEVKV